MNNQQDLKTRWMTRDAWMRAITASFVLIALACLSLSTWVGFKAVVLHEVPIGQSASLFSVGVVLLTSTRAMWDYARWGRNVASALAICLLWVIADAIARKAGIGHVLFKAPAIGLAAICLTYFTGPTGRHLFRKRDADEPAEMTEQP